MKLFLILGIFVNFMFVGAVFAADTCDPDYRRECLKEVRAERRACTSDSRDAKRACKDACDGTVCRTDCQATHIADVGACHEAALNARLACWCD